MIVSSLFALGFLAGGIAQAAWAAGWGEWQDWADDAEDNSSAAEDEIEDNNLYFGTVEGAMGACAVSSQP